MLLYQREAVVARERSEMARGTPEIELMRRASAALASVSAETADGAKDRRFVVFCGRGKNGGDGYGAADTLRRSGARVTVYDIGDGDYAELTAVMRGEYLAHGGDARPFDTDDASEVLSHADLAIDAMFGIGFHGRLRSPFSDAARLMNASGLPVVSADLPSGVECDSALAAEDSVRAAVTVALGCPKPAHYVQPAKSFCGRVTVADIGITAPDVGSDIELIDSDFVAERIKPRAADTHKGDYGKLLIVGGSAGYTGAPCLAADGALRSGVGIAFLAAPGCVYPIVAAKAAKEAVCLPMPSTETGYAKKAYSALVDRAKACSALLLGPGLGRSEESDKVALKLIKRAGCPLILDADGINAAAGNIDILRERSGRTIVTPHDVEFKRLGGDLSGGRIPGARALAADLGAVVVLKGNSTVVASPDGRVAVNSTGNPGMAKGGSGDVLAGVIAGLVSQGLDDFDAAACGVWLHGRAGDLAAEQLGEYGMLPGDLAAMLPYAIKPFGLRE